MAEIGICLATYNGAPFLDAQLASIAAQGDVAWHLYVRDDGSSDATPAMLAAFAAAHPGRVTLLEDGAGRCGVTGNFNRLMAAVVEPYIAFSDQDDVWRPGKLATALAAMKALEKAGGAAMVHADRALIDAGGRAVTASYWRARGVRPEALRGAEGHYLFCLAAGAAMLINRPLRDLACPVPEGARNYDCWIELLAHHFGRVAALDVIALDHRRHTSNASGGAADIDSAAARRPLARALRLWRGTARQQSVYDAYFRQARALMVHHASSLAPEARRRLERFVSIPGRGTLARAVALWQARAAPPGLVRRCVFLALTGPRTDPRRPIFDGLRPPR